MNRQTRTLLVLFIAVGTATVAAYAVYRAISRIPVREVEVATKQAVVASSHLKTGSLITRDNVKLVDWPARTQIVGGFESIDQVVDRGLLTTVSENEPLTETKLAPKEAGAGLPPSIPPGMRAMSVKVNEVIGVAGYVVAGTNVDVLVTLRQQGQARQESLSRVVVSNVQVLTAGQNTDPGSSDKGPITSTVVTLLVTPKDAERITLAQSEGTLMLALRNPLDLEPTTTPGVRTAGLFSGDAPPPAPAPVRVAARPAPRPTPPVVEPPPVAKAYTVEAIRGAKRSEEIVR